MREGLLILLTEDYYSYAGRITNPPRVGLGGCDGGDIYLPLQERLLQAAKIVFAGCKNGFCNVQEGGNE